MRKLALRVSFVIVPVLGVCAIACSDNNPAADSGPGEQVCPTNILEATAPPGNEGTTSKCHVENFTCVVGYLCGSFVQQATCLCTGGQFACTLDNPSHQALDQPVTDEACSSTIPPQDGGVPASCSLCQSVAPDGGPGNACPTDKTTADGTACTNAGQQCFYTNTCTGSPPPTDVCQCIANANGAPGLSWRCDLNQCP
ncbi:MAG TPA: hypothetical protein VGH28_12700 [Polyangiaceae bacterium]|jgi:hypothetical protein